MNSRDEPLPHRKNARKEVCEVAFNSSRALQAGILFNS
jgi:hypothetical protein